MCEALKIDRSKLFRSLLSIHYNVVEIVVFVGLLRCCSGLLGGLCCLLRVSENCRGDLLFLFADEGGSGILHTGIYFGSLTNPLNGRYLHRQKKSNR